MSTPPARTDAFEKEKQNYYEVLDIPPDASPSDIRQAYFRTKSAYGKDSNAIYSLFDANETKSLLERIEEAYLVLSNSDRRKEYDRTHGFFKGATEFQTSRKAPQKNVFTFGAKSEPANNNIADPAQNAAAAVFGVESIANDAELPFGAERSNEQQQASLRLSRPENNASMPRTLRDADDSPSTDFSRTSHENRHGPIRRVDIVKVDSLDKSFEDSIKSETDYRGSFIRRVREHRGVSVEELCEFTKISKNYINCIEAEEFDSLPAPAYVRGFVLQLAKAMKLAHDKVAEGYMINYFRVVGGK